MANPYYIPERETTADRIGSAMGVADTLQQMSLRPKELALKERFQQTNEDRLDVTQAQGEQRLKMLAQGNNLRRQEIAQRERIHQASLPIYQQPVVPSQMTKVDMMIRSQLGKEGAKELEWFTSDFDKAAENNMSRGELYALKKQKWPQERQRILESMETVIEKKKRGRPEEFVKWAESTEGKSFLGLRDMVSKDKDGATIYDKGIFAQTANAIATDQAKMNTYRQLSQMTEGINDIHQEMSSLMVDADGNPYQHVSRNEVAALLPSARTHGMDIKVIELDNVDMPGKWKNRKVSFPVMTMLGQAPTKDQIVDVLMTNYGYDMEDAENVYLNSPYSDVSHVIQGKKFGVKEAAEAAVGLVPER